MNDPIWTIKQAEELVDNYLNPLFKQIGIELKIVGSVKYQGYSNNDLDLIPIKLDDSIDYSFESFKLIDSILNGIDINLNDYCIYRFKYHEKLVEIFFPYE